MKTIFFNSAGNKYSGYDAASDAFGASYYLTLILGIMLLIMYFADIIELVLPKQWLKNGGYLQAILTSAGDRMETSSGKAASHRMKKMLNNALELGDTASQSSESRRGSEGESKDISGSNAIERFIILPKQTEKVGGIIWTWKRLFDGSIFAEHGIFPSCRLLMCNFAQLVVVGMIIFYTRYLYRKQANFFYDFTEENYKAFLNCIGASESLTPSYVNPYNETVENCANQYPKVKEAVSQVNFWKDAFMSLAITKNQYLAAAWVGLFVSLPAAIFYIVILIPSFVSTVLKYRSGVIPSLDDKDFLRCRHALDSVTVLLGFAFWGCFFSAVAAMALAVSLVSCS